MDSDDRLGISARIYSDSGSDNGGSDAIDSDVEERILSHLYYQSNAAATAIPDQVPASTPGTTASATPQRVPPPDRTEPAVADSDDESRYNIKGKAHAATNGANSRPPTHASSSSESSEDEGEIKEAPLSDSAAASAADSGLVTPLKAFTDLAMLSPALPEMEQQTVHIDALLSPVIPSAPMPAGSMVHTVAAKRPRDEENEYDYLDEAEIQGRNRYFMEEKEVMCRKCYRLGHLAKDCTTVTCTVCGEDNHTAKTCKQKGVVCLNCNMRGHQISECPRQSGRQRDAPRSCERCGSRRHHTDECATIWRRYVYQTPPPLKYSEVSAWCYNCADSGHFGDDCRQSRNRGAAMFMADTAFSADNCPGRCLAPTPRTDYGYSGSSPHTPRGRDSRMPHSAPSKRHHPGSGGYRQNPASTGGRKSGRASGGSKRGSTRGRNQDTPSKKPSRRHKPDANNTPKGKKSNPKGKKSKPKGKKTPLAAT
ncbi:hypothetical protein LPJ63_000824 [Coemansia sp. RSA 2711]|nr:hypothetical protein LPJ63_000824 [Coemansia sp. RSA 2711]